MDSNTNPPQSTPRTHNADKFSDEKTKEKIHKHLSDINDTISEEDIKNVITDVNVIQSAISGDNDETDSTGHIDEEKQGLQESEEYIDGSENKKTTPWDVLDA